MYLEDVFPALTNGQLKMTDDRVYYAYIEQNYDLLASNKKQFYDVMLGIYKRENINKRTIMQKVESYYGAILDELYRVPLGGDSIRGMNSLDNYFFLQLMNAYKSADHETKMYLGHGIKTFLEEPVILSVSDGNEYSGKPFRFSVLRDFYAESERYPSAVFEAGMDLLAARGMRWEFSQIFLGRELPEPALAKLVETYAKKLWIDELIHLYDGTPRIIGDLNNELGDVLKRTIPTLDIDVLALARLYEKYRGDLSDQLAGRISKALTFHIHSRWQNGYQHDLKELLQRKLPSAAVVAVAEHLRDCRMDVFQEFFGCMHKNNRSRVLFARLEFASDFKRQGDIVKMFNSYPSEAMFDAVVKICDKKDMRSVLGELLSRKDVPEKTRSAALAVCRAHGWERMLEKHAHAFKAASCSSIPCDNEFDRSFKPPKRVSPPAEKKSPLRNS